MASRKTKRHVDGRGFEDALDAGVEDDRGVQYFTDALAREDIPEAVRDRLLEAHRQGSRETYDQLVEQESPERTPPERWCPARMGSAQVSERERQRAVALAKRAARLAAADSRVQETRKLLVVPGIRFRRLGAGTDANGMWEDVEIDLLGEGRRPSPRKVRLRREPVLLELSSGPRRTAAELGSLVHYLLATSREIAITYGWSEADAVRFVLTLKPPKPDPILLRVLRPFTDGRVPLPAWVTVHAQEYVSRATVAAAFTKAANRGGRAIATRTVELVEFVTRLTDYRRRRPPWPQVASLWKREHPEWAADYRDLQKAYLRGVDALGVRRPKARRAPRRGSTEG